MSDLPAGTLRISVIEGSHGLTTIVEPPYRDLTTARVWSQLVIEPDEENSFPRIPRRADRRWTELLEAAAGALVIDRDAGEDFSRAWERLFNAVEAIDPSDPDR